jgi:nucleoside-diphosphate-sugar epimerase
MNPAGVLVTGSSGYLGSQVVAALAARGDIDVVALDLREPAQRLPGVIYETADIRAAEVDAIVGRHQPRVVVHRRPSSRRAGRATANSNSASMSAAPATCSKPASVTT